jgi:voltage-gated potassium channel
MSRAEAAPKSQPPKAEGLRLRARLRYLYHGSSPLAVRFRLAVIVIDFAIIGFFLAAPMPTLTGRTG